MIKEEFHIVMHCPVCGVPAETWLLDVPRVDPKAPATTILDEEHELDCDECGNRFEVTLRAFPGAFEVMLTEDTSQKGEFEHYDYDEDPPPEPGSYGIFLEALEEWRFNVNGLAEANGDSSRNRMLFATLYAIVEAYLSDAITGVALTDHVIMGKMLQLEGLKGKSVSLETVYARPGIVREMVKTTLQGLSFHNLGMVNLVCRSAFGKPFLPADDAERAILMKSLDKRHDCVHRNGHDKDGNKHTDIDKMYLIKLGILFEQSARSLETAIELAKIELPFEDVPAAK